MFATSSRQPSVPNGGFSQWATTESSPSTNRSRSSCDDQSNFGRLE